MSAFDEEYKFTENETATSNLIQNIEPNDHDGNPLYVLPENTYLYHANNLLYKFGSESEFKKPLYFSNSLANIEKYGCRFEFKTSKPLRLLAVDALSESSPFYTNAPREIQEILRENYGVTTEKRYRNSDKIKDDKFVKYLCDSGEFDGYMTKQMELEENSNFHPEIVLCDVKHCVTLEKQIDNDDYCETEYKLRKLQDNNPTKKKRKSRYSSPTSSPSSSNIFSNLFSKTPPRTPTRRGGKTKRIQKKQRKSLKKFKK